MAVVRPFRALAYDERVAGSLEALVAPPYDVIGPEERELLRARSPYNVVRLTLADSAEEAADTLRSWREQGALVRDDESAVYVIEQDYTGPDGVARKRTGLAASLRVEPYETGTVLPHERTHRGPKEGRLRLLRAVRTQLEPIFLLYDGVPPVAKPDRAPDMETDGTRVWRLADDGAVEASFRDRQLLIADGHHRYETAVAFHAEQGTEESAMMLVVLVSTEDEGLTIFPTHRLFATRPTALDALPVEVAFSGPVHEALARLAALPHDRPAAVRYEKGKADVVVGPAGELDVQLVDRLGHDGISYTPMADDAVAEVEEGRAAVAMLLRATRIEDVFAVARRGEVMPQKSTYFYPKLVSGLFLHPI